MAKEKKKSAKESSNLFHNIMKASVTPKSSGKDKIKPGNKTINKK